MAKSTLLGVNLSEKVLFWVSILPNFEIKFLTQRVLKDTLNSKPFAYATGLLVKCIAYPNIIVSEGGLDNVSTKLIVLENNKGGVNICQI